MLQLVEHCIDTWRLFEERREPGSGQPRSGVNRVLWPKRDMSSIFEDGRLGEPLTGKENEECLYGPGVIKCCGTREQLEIVKSLSQKLFP